MSKIFEIVHPKSLIDANYADFEYLIRWIGRDGSEYQLMFYDAEIAHSITGEVINRQTTPTLLVDSESRNITLVAEDLSLGDLSVVLEIFSNTNVTRLLTDGTVENYAPVPGSFRYRLMDLSYEITIQLAMTDLKTVK